MKTTIQISLFITIFLFFHYQSFSQSNQEENAEIDSLFSIFKAIPPDSLAQWVKAAEAIERKAENIPAATHAGYLRSIGIVMYSKSNFIYAEEYFLKAAAKYRQAGDTTKYIQMKANIAVLKELTGRYDAAIETYFEALHHFKQKNDKKSMAFVYNNLGVVNEEMGEYSAALDYYSKSLKLKTEMRDTAGIASSLNNIGVLYEGGLENADSARFYYQKSIEIYLSLKDEKHVAWLKNNMGNLFIKTAQYDSAQHYYHEAFRIFEKTGSKQGKTATLRNIGNALIEKENFREAENVLNTAYQLAKDIDDKKMQWEIAGLLAALYEKTGQYQQTVMFLKTGNALKDSLINFENKKNIAELETRYQTKIQKQQIDWQKEELTIKEKLLRKQRHLIIFISLGSLLFIAVIVLFYRHNRLKNKMFTMELQQKLLRVQMNPHFVFNTLGAIQNFMFENSTKKAAFYLGNFSSLMRSILDHSRSEKISLQQEIDALKSYIELEKMRISPSFEYSFDVASELDTEFTFIPPMLVQPFVENAIKHGIKPLKDRKGNLSVRISMQGEELCRIEIEDNGIGLKQAAKNRDASHTSHALDIFNERILLLKKSLKYSLRKKIRYTFTDISTMDKNSTGTQVVIQIPCFYD